MIDDMRSEGLRCNEEDGKEGTGNKGEEGQEVRLVSGARGGAIPPVFVDGVYGRTSWIDTKGFSS